VKKESIAEKADFVGTESEDKNDSALKKTGNKRATVKVMKERHDAQKAPIAEMASRKAKTKSSLKKEN
jgi:hypothetical protein